jgi:hypothetical protein
VFENRVVRRIFGWNRDEGNRGGKAYIMTSFNIYPLHQTQLDSSSPGEIGRPCCTNERRYAIGSEDRLNEATRRAVTSVSE